MFDVVYKECRILGNRIEGDLFGLFYPVARLLFEASNAIWLEEKDDEIKASVCMSPDHQREREREREGERESYLAKSSIEKKTYSPLASMPSSSAANSMDRIESDEAHITITLALVLTSSISFL